MGELELRGVRPFRNWLRRPFFCRKASLGTYFSRKLRYGIRKLGLTPRQRDRRMPLILFLTLLGAIAIFPRDASAELCEDAQFCARMTLEHDSGAGVFDPIGFDTGFVPGGSPFQIRAALNLGAASSVSLDGTLYAYSPQAVELGIVAPPHGGLLEMDFGFEMSLQARIDALGIKETFRIPIPYLPSDLRFSAEQAFTPYLLGSESSPVSVTDNIDRFDLVTVNIVDYVAPVVGLLIEGNIKVAASGQLSTHYRSVKLRVKDVGDFEADGQLLRLLAEPDIGYGPGRDLHVQLFGHMTYQGRLLLFPAIEMKVLGAGVFEEDLLEIPIDLVNAGGEVVFPEQTFRLGFPDIALAPLAVDFGEIRPGAVSTRYVRIENRGEEELTWTFEESGGAFAPFRPAGKLPANTASTLTLTYMGSGLGPEADLLTLHTNDPDTPIVQIAVFGSSLPPLGEGPDDGEEEDEEEAEEDEATDEDTDAGVPDPDAGDEEERVAYGGCSCDAGSLSALPLVELLLVALGFGVYRRRRFAHRSQWRQARP